jgi:GH15 family glucan-1,4-alpha-glucosidase
MPLRIALLLFFLPATALAQPEPVPSFQYLPTGNGFGLQVFDASQNAVVQFLERPYRFVRPNQSNPDAEGQVRRNLAFDTYFGLRSGSTSLWIGKETPDQVGYVDQSNVIRSAVEVGSLMTESYYFAPYGLAGNGMVMVLKVTNQGSSAATVTAFTVHNFKMGSAPNPDSPGAGSESVTWDAGRGDARETGPGGGTLIYVPIGGADLSTCADGVWNQVQGGQTLTQQASCSGTDKVDVFQQGLGSIPAGQSRTWGVAILFTDGGADAARGAWDSFAAGRDAQAILDGALAEWAAWRAPVPGLSPGEGRVWRQSEAVLRMGQILEPYSESPKRKNHGMILASLVPGQWHSGWVRDAAYAIVALARSGHHEEAKKALNFFLDAEAGKYASYVGGVDYQVSTVRYFGNGEEEADYSGQPTRNIEIDGWGLVLWAARSYVDASGDQEWLGETTRSGDTVYDVLKGGVADAIAANLEDSGMMIADASIWEVHWGNRQHFLYTTASAARGLCDMAALARRLENTGDRDRYKELSDQAVTAMRTHFVDQNNVLAGSLERLAQGASYHDGAVVEAFTWDLIPTGDPIATATMGDMSHLMTPVGGYKRVEGSSDQYDTDEWILIDLRASDAFRRMGNSERADSLVNWVTRQAEVNHDLIPELYNTNSNAGTIGRYSGSIPMVGYGAGAYMLTLLARGGSFGHADCGTVDPDEYPDAGSGLYTDGGPGQDGGANGFDGRTGAACLCSAGGGGSPLAQIALVVLVALCLRRRRGAALGLALVVAVSPPALADEEDEEADPTESTKTASIDIPVETEGGSLEEGVEPVKTTWFEIHGYARMPLNLETTPREPYLVDSDYYLSGFAYTRLYEPDWTELFVSAHHKNYRAKFGLFASLYSDYAETQLANQFGIAQASVAVDRFLGLRPLSVELGVFWDRYGYLAPYDTYMFGRTHQGGAKVRWSFSDRAYLQGGVGVHQALLQQNQGVTPLLHLAGGAPIGDVALGGYLLRSWTRDKRQLSPIEDGTMWIAGVDATWQLPRELGKVYGAVSHLWADQVLFLAPAVEVIHSTGGRGLTENFFGLADSENGTGKILAGALDAPLAVYGDRGEVRLFGMAARVRSEQIDQVNPVMNKDRRWYLKWGVEPAWRIGSHMRASLRYDRVILDMNDAENSFRALSPRLGFPLEDWGELAVQYTHYFYGDRVQLRPGQVPLETEPDTDAFKVQAQAIW